MAINRDRARARCVTNVDHSQPCKEGAESARWTSWSVLLPMLVTCAALPALPAISQTATGPQSRAANVRQVGKGQSSGQKRRIETGGANPVNVHRWHELIDGWSTISADDLVDRAKRVEALQQQIGDWPTGQISDPDSSANFLTASYFPNITAGYMYWRAGHLTTNPRDSALSRELYRKAAKALYPIVNSRANLPRFYQLPAVQAIYVASMLKSDQYNDDLLKRVKAFSAWRTKDRVKKAEAEVQRNILSAEWPALERKIRSEAKVGEIPPDKLTNDRKAFQEQAAVRAHNDKRAVDKVLARVELEQMLAQDGQGMPLILAHRLVESEQDALDEIRTELSKKSPITVSGADTQKGDPLVASSK